MNKGNRLLTIPLCIIDSYKLGMEKRLIRSSSPSIISIQPLSILLPIQVCFLHYIWSVLIHLALNVQSNAEPICSPGTLIHSFYMCHMSMVKHIESRFPLTLNKDLYSNKENSNATQLRCLPVSPSFVTPVQFLWFSNWEYALTCHLFSKGSLVQRAAYPLLHHFWECSILPSTLCNNSTAPLSCMPATMAQGRSSSCASLSWGILLYRVILIFSSGVNMLGAITNEGQSLP